MSTREEMEAAMEAVLFVAGEPVSEQRLLAIFEEGEREAAAAALVTLRERYAASPGRGLAMEEVAGGLRIVTAPEYHPYLRKFFEAAGGNKLSMAAIETLAIVAYRQPVTAPEIQELRGKSPQAAIKGLLERRMVRIAGRKEVVGRPFLYATTRDFLMHFGLRSLGDLPPLEEFEEALGLDGSIESDISAEPREHRSHGRDGEPSEIEPAIGEGDGDAVAAAGEMEVAAGGPREGREDANRSLAAADVTDPADDPDAAAPESSDRAAPAADEGERGES